MRELHWGEEFREFRNSVKDRLAGRCESGGN